MSGGSKPTWGGNGIISGYSSISAQASGYSNSDWGYLSGVNWYNSTTSINFSDMSEFTGRNNHCGPTTLLNYFVYMGYRNSTSYLINGSRLDTFNQMRTLTNHSDSSYVSFNNVKSAMIDYAEARGLITGTQAFWGTKTYTFGNSYSGYKQRIDSNDPVITLLNVTQSNGDNWGHFVLTLGYEEFSQAYTKQVLWWTTTEYRYKYFIRISDAWSTRNDVRYVSLDNGFDSYNNCALDL